MTGLDSRVLLAPGDGSHGPLLRMAEDRLPPGAGYGAHDHRDVDVVAVVLAGSLTHRWGGGAVLGAGDVGVLRAGTGLRHDEVAGPDGAHVVQTYLRTALPGRQPGHEVRVAPAGWVDLGRPDAALWLARVDDGRTAGTPPGLRLVARAGAVTVEPVDGPVAGPATVWVGRQVTARPAWAG
jgi:redox-sensitive bicupin YhaK (pirin superfamily)